MKKIFTLIALAFTSWSMAQVAEMPNSVTTSTESGGCPDPFVYQDLQPTLYMCPGASTQLAVDAEGTGLTYQWQNSTDGISWNNISNEDEYNYTVTSPGFYQVVMSTSCGSSTTSAVTQAFAATINIVGATVQGSNTTICEGESIAIDAHVSQTNTYSWFPGGMTDASVTVSPTVSTTYFVTGTAVPSGCVGTGVIDITVIPAPIPSIMEDNGSLQVDNGPFSSYQWYFDGDIIPNADQSTYVPMENGDYTVMVNDGSCNGTSATHPFTGLPTGIQNGQTDYLRIYPNPFTTEFLIEAIASKQIRVMNALGEVVLSRTINGRTSIDASSLSTGVYFVQEETSGAAMKLVKH